MEGLKGGKCGLGGGVVKGREAMHREAEAEAEADCRYDWQSLLPHKAGRVFSSMKFADSLDQI